LACSIVLLGAAAMGCGATAEAPTDDPPPDDGTPIGTGSGGKKTGGAGGGNAGGGGGGGASAGNGGSSGGNRDAGPGSSTDAPVGKPGDPPAPNPSAAVVISEIMYHPVTPDGADDLEEFVEIHNRSNARVSLAGWKLSGDVTFTFPADAALEAGQYKVVARNKAKLTAVAAYALKAADVWGDYTGKLDNGGGSVVLTDDKNAVSDSVRYNDKFPWPSAADAMGAGNEWLPMALQPVEKHNGMGRSLERIAVDREGAVWNWEASAVDKATPNAKNGAAGAAKPVVEAVGVKPDTGAVARENVGVTISAGFSKIGEVKSAEVEYYVEALTGAQPTPTKAPMAAVGEAWEAKVPGQKANSIVRYRIYADRGAGREQVYPRATDPLTWKGYFVEPAVATDAPVYSLFIHPANWEKIHNFMKDGQIACGTCNTAKLANWKARVPATFTYKGEVYDVWVRYQGSRWNRWNGTAISSAFTGVKPTNTPNPFNALSWHLKFPRSQPFKPSKDESKNELVLHKLRPQPCFGLYHATGTRLMKKAGVPAFQPRFARFYVNGGYYHYMMEWIDSPDNMAEKIQQAEMAKEQGPIFEAGGLYCDEGIWGISDGRPIGANTMCNFTAKQRFEFNYNLKNDSVMGAHDRLQTLLTGLESARRMGGATLKTFMQTNFDMEKLLRYVAILNWSGVWDDTYHNFHFYRRPTDGKWYLIPWDFDEQWTTDRVNNSIFVGEQGNRSNGIPYNGNWNAMPLKQTWNKVKDAVFKSHREEYRAELNKLMDGILSPTQFDATIDEALKDLNMSDMMQAPTWPAGMCNLTTLANQMKKFGRDRTAWIKSPSVN
jgi:hypothetical protein